MEKASWDPVVAGRSRALLKTIISLEKGVQLKLNCAWKSHWVLTMKKLNTFEDQKEDRGVGAKGRGVPIRPQTRRQLGNDDMDAVTFEKEDAHVVQSQTRRNVFRPRQDWASSIRRRVLYVMCVCRIVCVMGVEGECVMCVLYVSCVMCHVCVACVC